MTVRLRNARERLSHTILAVANSEAPAEDLIAAEHVLARALDWPGRTHGPPSSSALKEARRETYAMIAELPALARRRVRARLAAADIA